MSRHYGRCRGFYQDRQRSNNMSNMTIIRELTARDQGFEPSAKIEKSIELIKNIQKSNPGQKIIVFPNLSPCLI